jgi:hypothetical protein
LGEFDFFDKSMHMARDGLHDLFESWVITGPKSIYNGICQIVFGEVEHVISYQFGVCVKS